MGAIKRYCKRVYFKGYCYSLWLFVFIVAPFDDVGRAGGLLLLLSVAVGSLVDSLLFWVIWGRYATCSVVWGLVYYM